MVMTHVKPRAKSSQQLNQPFNSKTEIFSVFLYLKLNIRLYNNKGYTGGKVLYNTYRVTI